MDRSRNRANGATQTFRRSSQAVNTTTSTRENQSNSATTISSPATHLPPHPNTQPQPTPIRNGFHGEARYNKDQLIELYELQRDSGTIDENLLSIFTGGWDPLDPRNSDELATAWNRKDEGRDSNIGPEICWHHNGSAQPLALTHMTDEEREVGTSLSISICTPCSVLTIVLGGSYSLLP